MGTINYGTSKYITLGIEPYDENEIAIELLECGECDSPEEAIELAYAYIDEYYQSDVIRFNETLENADLWFFNIELRNGYYEGLYITIEPTYDTWFADGFEKQQCQVEITEIRQILRTLANSGFVACYPWWCTRYKTRKDTLKAIDEAIKEMREEVRKTPTRWWVDTNRREIA